MWFEEGWVCGVEVQGQGGQEDEGGEMADVPGGSEESLGQEEVGVGGREGEQGRLQRLDRGRGRGESSMQVLDETSRMRTELDECSQCLRPFVSYSFERFAFRLDLSSEFRQAKGRERQSER